MEKIDLGQFSVSLSVKNMDESLTFYEKLSFEVIDGGHINPGFPDGEDTKWRILKSGNTVIGLFQGMFENNVMTFNPHNVRDIQKHLKSAGIDLIKEADEASEGPEHIILLDPDGNQIMLDQH
jgi:catechol 2,3-dioxygenase-like lactoylglutathione lyase family enzyme